MKKKSEVLERLRERITLKTKLTVAFQMHDYDNWSNGDYNGDAEKYVELAIEVMNKHAREHNYKPSDGKLPLCGVVVPKGKLCKCRKEFEVYNKLEGTMVCTLCGNSRLA